MENQVPKILPPDIAKAKDELCHWRKNKKSPREPIPKHLWSKAAELARAHSINQVAKALRLSYADLKDKLYPEKKTAEKTTPFIELKGQPILTPEAMLEIENPKGSKLRISFRGATDFDLTGLAKAFMDKSP